MKTMELQINRNTIELLKEKLYAEGLSGKSHPAWIFVNEGEKIINLIDLAKTISNNEHLNRIMKKFVNDYQGESLGKQMKNDYDGMKMILHLLTKLSEKKP